MKVKFFLKYKSTQNIPSGYLIRDGNFISKKSYIANSNENILFDVEYDIVEGHELIKIKIKIIFALMFYYLGLS